MKRIYIILFTFHVFCFLLIVNGCSSEGDKEENKNDEQKISGIVKEIEYFQDASGVIISFNDGRVVALLNAKGHIFQKGEVNVINYSIGNSYHPNHLYLESVEIESKF